MASRRVKISLTAAICLLLLPCAVSWAGFRLDVVEPVLPVDKWFTMDVVVEPEQDRKVFGGQVIVEVDPDAVRLSEKRERYGSSEMFSVVERFDIKAASGTVIFRAGSSEEVTGPKVFLRVRAMLKRTGATTLRFSSSILAEDGKRKPSTDGYYRLFGIEDGEVDPLLHSALMTENNRLRMGVKVRERKEMEVEGGEMLGVMELREVKEREEADAIIGFSHNSLRVGKDQYIRLDIEVKKLPSLENMNVLSVAVMYDTGALKPVDYGGFGSNNTVDLIPPFTFALANRINRAKGEVYLEVSTPMDGMKGVEETEEITEFPVRVATLYFKAMREMPETVVRFGKVMMDVSSDATVLKEDARVKIEGKRLSCAPGLPATLCSGNIDITGAISMRVTNSKEVRGATAGTNTAQTGGSTINRMYLDQTWDLEMGGGFKNGWSLKGDVHAAPHSPQILHLSLASTNWEFLFGDYGANLTGGKMVGLTQRSASGFQWNYHKGPWSLKTALVESRTTPGQAIVVGTGISGPYQIAGVKGKAIILGSIRVEKNDAPLAPDKYDVDMVRGEIKFADNLLATDKLVVYYEQSSFIFSTGDVSGARLDYAPDNKRLKAGATYIQAKSNIEGTTLRYNTFGDFSLPASDSGLPKCSGGLDTESSTCVEVNLQNMYVVPNSIVITQVTYTGKPDITDVYDEGDELFIPHRGYFLGRIYVDYEKMKDYLDLGSGQYSQFRVSYDYYNPAFIDTTGLVVYPKPATNNTLGQPWPTQMFPGSEQIYESDNAEYRVDSFDMAAEFCHKDNREASLIEYTDASGDEYDFEIWDDPEVCDVEYANSPPLKWYKLEQSGINYYLDFTDSTFGTDKNYIKMTYYTIPSFLPTSSEFDKVALGVNAEYKLGRKWNFTADWGRTNSDLSSTFHTFEDRIEIDAETFASSNKPGRCEYKYDPVEEGDEHVGMLICPLSHDKIFGEVTVRVERCKRYDYPENPNYVCIEGEYKPAEALNIRDINVEGGYVYIRGQNERKYCFDGKPVTECEEENVRFYEYSKFPDKDDVLVVSYVYEPTLSKLVEADGYDFTAGFNSKAFKKPFSLSFHRHEHDPNYDKRMGGGGEFTSLFDIKTGFGVKKLGVKMDFLNRQNDVTRSEQDKTGELKSSLKSPSRTITLNYAATGRMDQIIYTKTIKKDYGITSVANDQRKDTTNKNSSFGTGYSLNKNGTMKVGYRHQLNDTADNMTSTPATRQKTDTYNWNYARSKKTTLAAAFSSSKTTPTNSKTTTNNYVLKLKPLAITQSLNVNFTRSRSYTEPTTGPQTNIIDSIAYGLVFIPIWKISNLSYNFSRRDTAPTGSQVVGTRSDNTAIGLTFKHGQRFEYVPNLNQTSNSSETSRSRSRTTGWRASYKVKVGKRTSYTLDTDKKHTRTSSDNMTTISTTTTSSTSRGLTLNYKPGEKYSHNFIYKNSKQGTNQGRTGIRNYTYSFGYLPHPRLSFSTRYNLTRSSGITSKRAYNLIMSYKINNQTKLDLNYSRDTIAGSSRPSGQRRTKFQAELKTDFRGKR